MIVSGDEILLFKNTSLAFILVASLTPHANASVIYSYSGNAFMNFNGPAFSANDSVSGEFALTSALGDNFNGEVAPSQFSFSNGLFSIADSSLPASVFDIQTSDTGQIIQWSIALSINSGPVGARISTTNLSDFSYIIGPTTFSSAGNNGDPGGWSAVATPLPGGLPLFVTGLGALGLFGFWRKRKGAVVGSLHKFLQRWVELHHLGCGWTMKPSRLTNEQIIGISREQCGISDR